MCELYNFYPQLYKAKTPAGPYLHDRITGCKTSSMKRKYSNYIVNKQEDEDSSVFPMNVQVKKPSPVKTKMAVKKKHAAAPLLPLLPGR